MEQLDTKEKKTRAHADRFEEITQNAPVRIVRRDDKNEV